MNKPRKNKKKKQTYVKPPVQSKFVYQLDHFSEREIAKGKQLQYVWKKIEWSFYNELKFQRSNIIDKIHAKLIETCKTNYNFQKWQRVITWKYSTNPLSIIGSIKDPAGGRFNVGDIDRTTFPSFPALYIAEDAETAIQEKLMNKVKDDAQSCLDTALAKKASFSCISVSGSLDAVINLNNPKTLKPFVYLIRNFSISEYLRKASKTKRNVDLTVVKNVKQLLKTLLDKNWRFLPMQLDIPSSSQIFGELVMGTGIDGIVYPSKYTGKECLCIFPQNFKETGSSYVQVDHQSPPGTKIIRWDHETWKSQREI